MHCGGHLGDRNAKRAIYGKMNRRRYRPEHDAKCQREVKHTRFYEYEHLCGWHTTMDAEMKNESLLGQSHGPSLEV